MKKLLREQSVAILAFLVALFFTAIISLYIWGIGYLITSEDKANNLNTTAVAAPEFNVAAAAKLDYRGTLQQPSGQ